MVPLQGKPRLRLTGYLAGLSQSEAKLDPAAHPSDVIGCLPHQREPISARRPLRHSARFRFNMAAAVTSAAPSAMDCAGREDADCPENEVTGGDAELPERQLQVPQKENAELVAEAEAVAAGWMLDFLCLSLCRAFRDGRSEDFRRTRDSAEGGCEPRTAGGLPERPREAGSCELGSPAASPFRVPVGLDRRTEWAKMEDTGASPVAFASFGLCHALAASSSLVPSREQLCKFASAWH